MPKEKESLVSVFLRTKLYAVKEFFHSLRYYKNFRLLFADTLIFLLYLPFNPYRISRKFLESRGEKNVYAYGETPFSTLEVIAKNFEITEKDHLLEVGSGRGRGCFYFASLSMCKVIGVEWNPFFFHISKIIQKLLFHDSVSFVCGDISELKLPKVTLVDLYGTSMEDDLLKKLLLSFKTLPTGIKIITISYSLAEFSPNDHELLHEFEVSFPWGKTTAYLQKRLANG